VRQVLRLHRFAQATHQVGHWFTQKNHHFKCERQGSRKYCIALCLLYNLNYFFIVIFDFFKRTLLFVAL
jgi:hypothetical protein